MITGDLVYVRAHLFMGFDVNFVAQCDWISALLNLKTNLNASTVLYPGHGSPSWDISATQIIQENIDYIQFARTIYGMQTRTKYRKINS
jgi:glyoxylase-like metal-dependent hydrolase (beta-lactamase superfamily II)